MPASSRFGDMWTGICCCHTSPTCIPMVGIIVTGSVDAVSSNQGQGRMTDMTIGYCGHPGVIISSSVSHKTNSLGTARIGDLVTGCNIGVLITGNPSHIVG
jgi:hypothetical protein